MCTIKGCDAPPVAKGLCTKHYARWRRSGDANNGRKSGRPLDHLLAITAQMFPNWSSRTRATYAEAWRRFDAIAELAGDEDPDKRMRDAINSIIRRNGSFSVAKLNAISEEQASLLLASKETGPAEEERVNNVFGENAAAGVRLKKPATVEKARPGESSFRLRQT